MNFYPHANEDRIPTPQASALLTTATFGALISGCLIVGASLPGRRQSPADHPKTASVPRIEPDADFDNPVVDVIAQGESVHFRFGSQDASSAVELKRLLEPLARFGGSISVRVNHDGPFMHTATAVIACREAGFTSVSLLPAAPPR